MRTVQAENTGPRQSENEKFFRDMMINPGDWTQEEIHPVNSWPHLCTLLHDFRAICWTLNGTQREMDRGNSSSPSLCTREILLDLLYTLLHDFLAISLTLNGTQKEMDQGNSSSPPPIPSSWFSHFVTTSPRIKHQRMKVPRPKIYKNPCHGGGVDGTLQKELPVMLEIELKRMQLSTSVEN